MLLPVFQSQINVSFSFAIRFILAVAGLLTTDSFVNHYSQRFSWAHCNKSSKHILRRELFPFGIHSYSHCWFSSNRWFCCESFSFTNKCNPRCLMYYNCRFCCPSFPFVIHWYASCWMSSTSRFCYASFSLSFTSDILSVPFALGAQTRSSSCII